MKITARAQQLLIATALYIFTHPKMYFQYDATTCIIGHFVRIARGLKDAITDLNIVIFTAAKEYGLDDAAVRAAYYTFGEAWTRKQAQTYETASTSRARGFIGTQVALRLASMGEDKRFAALALAALELLTKPKTYKQVSIENCMFGKVRKHFDQLSGTELGWQPEHIEKVLSVDANTVQHLFYAQTEDWEAPTPAIEKLKQRMINANQSRTRAYIAAQLLMDFAVNVVPLVNANDYNVVEVREGIAASEVETVF